MNVLSNLTIKNLKLNKVRTIVTLIGIILSTSLLVALSGLCSSFLCTMEQMSILNDGQQHVIFYDVPKEELSTIQLHKETAHYYMIELLDTFMYNDTSDIESSVVAMDQKALLENENTLIEGRLPENSSEILLGNDYIYDEIEVGDGFTLPNGTTYQVVGKVNSYAVKGVTYSQPIILYMDEPTGDTSIAVTYKNVKNYEEITRSIVGENEKYEYSYNAELLRYQAQVMSGGNMQMIYAMAGIVSIIILLTSVFCIRNSFAISITEKIRQYGMLASVGATPKQIRKNVLFEGTILGLIGIPIGVCSGTLACFILVKVSNYLLDSSVSIESALVFHIHPIFIAIAVLLAAITIYLSAISSAIRASKISEIEAIRSTQDIKIKAKQVKTPKYIEKLLGVGGVFAYKNLKRNRRKFRTTTISLIVSIATFITLSSFIQLGFQMARAEYKAINYNMQITGADASALWDTILTIDDVEEKNYIMSYPAYYMVAEDFGYMSWNLYTMEEAYYAAYLQDEGIEYQEDVVVLLDSAMITTTDGKTKIDYFIESEDQITLSSETEELDDLSELQFEFVRPEEYPLGFVENSWMGILMSQTQFEKYALDESLVNYEGIFLNANDSYDVEKIIREYDELNDLDITITNIDEFVKAYDNMLLLIAIFLYGFIAVIILVGLTNIFNSLSTNMNLRRKEFATLQSIGMTKKEFSRMITFESVAYVCKSLLWGVPLGTIGAYALYQASSYGNIEYTFHMPYQQIVCAAIVVFLVVYGIMKVSLSKIAKQNIIETIRQENI